MNRGRTVIVGLIKGLVERGAKVAILVDGEETMTAEDVRKSPASAIREIMATERADLWIEGVGGIMLLPDDEMPLADWSMGAEGLLRDMGLTS